MKKLTTKQKVTGTIFLLGIAVAVGIILLENQKKVITISDTYISEIYIELNSDNTKSIKTPGEGKIILDAKAELLDEESKIITDSNMSLNNKTKVAEPEEGYYKIHLLAAPIEIDGSTYKLPETIIDFLASREYRKLDRFVINNKDFKITYKKNIIVINVKLERLAIESMTKEQVNAVVERIEKEAPNKYPELITALKAKAELAISNPESEKDVSQPSTSTGTSTVKKEWF